MTSSQESVRIVSIAAGGDGVGRLSDGRAVFVPRTAPGDLVELADLRVLRSFARAGVGRIVEPSPERVEPRCVHYVRDECGGCALQHIAYEAQLRVKGRIVRDALERIAKLAPGDVEVVPNPAPFGWRSRLSLAIDFRTGAAGLRKFDRPGEVFALDRCEIASPALQRLWTALHAVPGGVPARTERIDLRESRDGVLHVTFHGVLAVDVVARVGTALATAGVDARVVCADTPPPAPSAPPRGRGRGGRRPARDDAANDEETGGAGFFEQVDRAMGELVRRHAISSLGEVRNRRVWDLYAGIGETSDLLVEAGALVESVERDRAAVAEAERAGSPDVLRHAARVEDVIARLGAADAVIVNPPRAGMGAAVVGAILPCAPEQFVYVSCDPATLARDLGAMREVYDLVSVRAFDSYPQTAHVETVAVLRRRG